VPGDTVSSFNMREDWRQPEHGICCFGKRQLSDQDVISSLRCTALGLS
jgi:hypothetical protein